MEKNFNYRVISLYNAYNMWQIESVYCIISLQFVKMCIILITIFA